MEIALIWMTGALVAGQICRWLSIPVIIGFIGAGYFFTQIDLNDSQNILAIPAEIGVELLLFSIGLKIKPSDLLNQSLFVVFILHTLSISIIYFFLININIETETKILLCIALTFSSTIIASKSLEGRKELTTFHGRLSVLTLIFQDILAVLILVYSSNTSWSFNILYLLLIPIVVPFLKLSLDKIKASEELELLSAILIALFLGSYLFKYLGLTGEIGALTLGVLLANYKAAERLSDKIWSLREILLVAFFISLGMKLNISTEIILSSLLYTSLLLIKSIILFFLLIFFKLRAYTAFLIVVSLTTFSEFSLIIISFWAENGLLGNQLFSSLIFTVVTSFVLGAILNKYVHEIYVLLENILKRFERLQHHPDEQPHTCGGADVMVLGMGRIGKPIFENLAINGIKVVGFDADTNLVKEQLREGKRVTFADAEDPGFWSGLRFGKLKAIVLALPEYHAQNWSTKQARKFGFEGRIIVPTRSQGDPNKLKESGADEIYDAYQAAGIGVTEILLRNNP